MTTITMQPDLDAMADGPMCVAHASSRATRRRTWSLRLMLFAGAVAAALMAMRIGDPSVLLGADPDLARLLRGMAVIKAMLVVAFVGIVAWRFGHPTVRRSAAGYLAGVVTMAFATAMIWQLSAIVAAAIVFHVGALLSLVVAWRDDGAFARFRGRRAMSAMP